MWSLGLSFGYFLSKEWPKDYDCPPYDSAPHRVRKDFAVKIFNTFGGPCEGFGDYYLDGIGAEYFDLLEENHNATIQEKRDIGEVFPNLRSNQPALKLVDTMLNIDPLKREHAIEVLKS